MVNKTITTFVALLFTLTAYGQQNIENDTVAIKTVDDIIQEQQGVTQSNLWLDHITEVWAYKKFLNISYNMSVLQSKNPILTGVAYNGGIVPKFSSNWGFSLQRGTNIALHKKPIANFLRFNLDFVGMDLNFNHYSQEGDGLNLYDSRVKNYFLSKNPYQASMDSAYYTPWNLEKYEANFGMRIGPSVTFAPFVFINGARALHYLRINAYFHLGYRISAIYMMNDKYADAAFQPYQELTALINNYNGTMTQAELQQAIFQQAMLKNDVERCDNNLKFDWGHGMTMTYGINMTYRRIGIGYEHTTGSMKYKALNTSDYGKSKYKFTSTTSRVYLSIRLGK